MPSRTFMLSRRRVLGGAGIALAVLGRPVRLVAEEASDRAAEGFRVVRASAGLFVPRGTGAAPVSILGYGGVVPGPLLRVKRGEELRVRLANDLSEPTAIHWHGVRLPNGMDGVPGLTQPPVIPGASFDYVFRPQDAGTFWYHAPWYGTARRAPGNDLSPAARRLYGVLVVEEPEPIEADREHVVVFDDWPVASESSVEPAGASQIQLMANGTLVPDFAVKTNERVRLRLINAANARVMSLRVDRHGVRVMAIDGQPAEQFIARESRVMLGPGNSIDLLIDAVLDSGTVAPIMCDDNGTERPIARLVYEQAPPVRPVPLGEPKPLATNPLPTRLDFAHALKLDLVLDALTQLPLAPHDRPARFTLKRGRTVMLALVNRNDVPCAVHVHGHAFRLLDRLDDGWKPFWLNTTLIAAKQTARIAFLADNPGRWLIESAAIGRPGSVSAAWFEVV